MTTQTAAYAELIERLTPEATLTLYDISWETYEDLLEAVGEAPALRISFFGRATMKKQEKLKGAEPDACFYVKSAAAIGNKIRIDLNSDPPPDIVLETDIHHDSQSKLPIYAALGVPEVWRFEGEGFDDLPAG